MDSESRCFTFMTFDVVVELIRRQVEAQPGDAGGGCSDDGRKFKIWFTVGDGVPTLAMVSHECWHLFMSIMSYVDQHEHRFSELADEVYAYSFQTLFSTVLDFMLGSEMYQKALKGV